jgi:integrase
MSVPLRRVITTERGYAARSITGAAPAESQANTAPALQLSTPALAALRQAVAGKEPEELVFDLTYKQIRGRWEAARDRAGMPWLRFKDLRGVFGTYWAKEGGSIRGLQGYYGHADPKMSLRYTKHLPQTARDQAEAAVKAMGLGRSHLKIEEA